MPRVFPNLTRNQQKNLTQLLQKKYREQQNQFLAEGVRLCGELLHSSAQIHCFVITERFWRNPLSEDIVKQAQEKNVPIYLATEEQFSRLSDTQEPQSIIGYAQQFDHTWQAEKFASFSRLLVLVDIADPGNLGTMIRTATALNWDGIICVGHSVDFYNPKVIRSSMGAFFHLPCTCISQDTVMSFFEDNSILPILTVVKDGELPPYHSLPDKLALFLGNEAHGLPPTLVWKKARKFQIKMSQLVDSLNVAVAGGIMLFLLKKE